MARKIIRVYLVPQLDQKHFCCCGNTSRFKHEKFVQKILSEVFDLNSSLASSTRFIHKIAPKHLILTFQFVELMARKMVGVCLVLLLDHKRFCCCCNIPWILHQKFVQKILSKVICFILKVLPDFLIRLRKSTQFWRFNLLSRWQEKMVGVCPVLQLDQKRYFCCGNTTWIRHQKFFQKIHTWILHKTTFIMPLVFTKIVSTM